MRRAILLAIAVVLPVSWCQNAAGPATKTSTPPLRIGVLPFSDATGELGSAAAQALSRAVQAEFVHASTLHSRVLPLEGISLEEMDAEKAVEIGRKYKVDVVLLATVLEASTEQSSKGGWAPTIFGQSVRGNLHNVQARVTFQADLLYLGTGAKVASLRLSGQHTDRSVSADAYTSLGTYSNDDSNWQKSTLGKAVQKVVGDMVRQVSAQARALQPVSFSAAGSPVRPTESNPPAQAKEEVKETAKEEVKEEAKEEVKAESSEAAEKPPSTKTNPPVPPPSPGKPQPKSDPPPAKKESPKPDKRVID